MYPSAHPMMHTSKMYGVRPYDPHFASEDLMHDIWRDFDKGVMVTIRRQRRARLLAAFRRRHRRQAPRPTASPTTRRAPDAALTR